MKLLDNIFKTVEPMFEKGGKLERLYPIYEATESFFLTSDQVTDGRVHLRDGIDSKRLMITVVIALTPTVIWGAYNTGLQRQIALGVETDIFSTIMLGLWYILPIIITSYAVGGICETLFSIIRKEEITEGFLVTGLLYPLSLPATTPLWMVAIGIIFGVVIGKEVFGGTGYNILNPALTARAFVFFSYPAYMSGDKVWVAVDAGREATVEGWSGATALGVAARETGSYSAALAGSGYTWMDSFLGFIPGSIGETSTLLIIVGAFILLSSKVASWRTMVGVVLGTAGMATVLNVLQPAESAAIIGLPFWWHFVIGSFAFGTVYMATDPVSSASTKQGKWVYGILIGVLIVLIRCVNPAYPEGVMLAILFMNVFAPLIDYVVVQRHVTQRTLARA